MLPPEEPPGSNADNDDHENYRNESEYSAGAAVLALNARGSWPRAFANIDHDAIAFCLHVTSSASDFGALFMRRCRCMRNRWLARAPRSLLALSLQDEIQWPLECCAQLHLLFFRWSHTPAHRVKMPNSPSLFFPQ